MYWTAYLCLLVGALIPILVVFIAKSDDRLDVSKPRDLHLVQTGVRKRAYGAHLNGLEAFPFFAAAIVTAVQVEVEPELLNHAAIGWVVIRVAYTIAYLAVDRHLPARAALSRLAIGVVAGIKYARLGP